MEYSEPYYTSQLDNLAKMDKFFERHKLSKLTQKEIGKMNNPHLLKKLIVKNSFHKENSRPI